MKLTIEEMRAVCVAYYVDKGYSLIHSEIYVPKDEAEIRRIYGCIQEEENCGESSNPLLSLADK